MHTNEPIVFDKITPEHFANLEVLAQKHNLSVVGTSGRTQKDGFDVDWGYDPETQVLTIKILQSPFWAPEFMIQEHFENWVSESDPDPEIKDAPETASETASAQTIPEQVTPLDASVPAAPTDDSVNAAAKEQKAPISPK